MSAITSSHERPARTTTAGRHNPAKWFYAISAVVMLALTVIGFKLFFFQGQSYPGREITPPIRTLIIAHGLVMSGWIVLFMVQPLLIATRHHKLHMNLGRLGVLLAAGVVVVGTLVSVQSARVSPPDMKIWGMSPKPFMAVPLISVWVFGVLVAVAVWKRRRPALHRAMMLTATLAVVDAAISRIDFISNQFVGTLWERLFGPFFGMIVIGAALLALRCAMARAFDRHLALGLVILTATSAGTMALAPTAAWDAFASLLVP